MFKKWLAILLCLALTLIAVSCSESGNPSGDGTDGTSADTEGITSGAATSDVPSEDELYEYNPRVENAYRKNDNTILFSVDTSVKDPDGNLYEHIYVAATPDGEPIARAVSADFYEPKNGMAKIWGANFDVTLPETVYLCFEELDGEGNGDGDFETVLCDVVNTGIYAGTVLESGKRILAVQTTDTEIVANLWVEIPLREAEFVAPEGIPVEHGKVVEGVITTFMQDSNGYCEFTYTGSGVRLMMLCNIQDNGQTCHNVPALIMYLDGEEYTTISMTDPEKYTWDNAPDIVFEDVTIPYGTHTVRFVNTTEGNFTSAAAYYYGIFYLNG